MRPFQAVYETAPASPPPNTEKVLRAAYSLSGRNTSAAQGHSRRPPPKPMDALSLMFFAESNRPLGGGADGSPRPLVVEKVALDPMRPAWRPSPRMGEQPQGWSSHRSPRGRRPKSATTYTGREDRPEEFSDVAAAALQRLERMKYEHELRMIRENPHHSSPQSPRRTPPPAPQLDPPGYVSPWSDPLMAPTAAVNRLRQTKMPSPPMRRPPEYGGSPQTARISSAGQRRRRSESLSPEVRTLQLNALRGELDVSTGVMRPARGWSAPMSRAH